MKGNYVATRRLVYSLMFGGAFGCSQGGDGSRRSLESRTYAMTSLQWQSYMTSVGGVEPLKPIYPF